MKIKNFGNYMYHNAIKIGHLIYQCFLLTSMGIYIEINFNLTDNIKQQQQQRDTYTNIVFFITI